MVNCEGAAYMIRQLGHNRVGSLHIHDNDLYNDLHTLPFLGKIDWKEVMRALKEIDYKGNFTYENTSFFKCFPDEFLMDCLVLSEKVGGYLMRLMVI